MKDPKIHKPLRTIMQEIEDKLTETHRDIVEGYSLALLKTLPEGATVDEYALCIQLVTRGDTITTRYWLEPQP